MNRIPSLDILPICSDETLHINTEELQNLGNKICEVLRNCGLTINKIQAQVGITFYHIETELEQDVSVEQVKELVGSQLDTNSNRVLTTSPYLFHHTVGFEIPRATPDMISVHRLISHPRYQEDERKYIALPLGATINNETFIQSMFLIGSVLIVGRQRSADNSMLRSIYLSILYKQLPMNVKVLHKTIDESLDKFMVRVADEIMERKHYPCTRDVNLFVLIENIDSYYPLSGIAKEILDVLLTQGDGLNIYSVITAKQVDKDTLFIHERVRAHCAFLLPNQDDSIAIIGNDNAAYLAPQGECYWLVDEEEPIRISIPDVTEETLTAVLEQSTWIMQQ